MRRSSRSFGFFFYVLLVLPVVLLL
jgi:hypothetical protein